ncbi:hypothetical protein B0H13DRAFT_1928707 [Mycena leptocephala]|nr:hypothetical protein B0H13DRAFT_1928707 [Mycena leptocephala]
MNTDPKSQKRGGFKLTSFGRSSKPLLGSAGNLDICAKRTYYEKKVNGITHYFPHPSPRQGQDLITEVLCNVWSACLLNEVYAGIDKYISMASTSPPWIPKMRFVEVAFATDGKQTDMDNGRQRTVLLLEEVINETEEGPFRKFVNNRAPVPTTFKDQRNIDTAAFLAFTQHWQFKMTHGLAFVSDYQGGNSLLTDPQVMSDSKLGDIFATGNIPSGCRDFASSHECNKYCDYFQIAGDFSPMPEMGGDETKDMEISVADMPGLRNNDVGQEVRTRGKKRKSDIESVNEEEENDEIVSRSTTYYLPSPDIFL